MQTCVSHLWGGWAAMHASMLITQLLHAIMLKRKSRSILLQLAAEFAGLAVLCDPTSEAVESSMHAEKLISIGLQQASGHRMCSAAFETSMPAEVLISGGPAAPGGCKRQRGGSRGVRAPAGSLQAVPGTAPVFHRLRAGCKRCWCCNEECAACCMLCLLWLEPMPAPRLPSDSWRSCGQCEPAVGMAVSSLPLAG